MAHSGGNSQYSKANLSSCSARASGKEGRAGGAPGKQTLRRTMMFLAMGGLLAAGSAGGPQAPAQGSQDIGETYNPLLAEKDLEVGLYYFKSKSYDAAIERLKSCLVHRPNYAKPRWYLAQSYEKKGQWEEAIQYYREFVGILPDTKEGKQASEKIETLTRKLEEKKKRKK